MKSSMSETGIINRGYKCDHTDSNEKLFCGLANPCVQGERAFELILSPRKSIDPRNRDEPFKTPNLPDNICDSDNLPEQYSAKRPEKLIRYDNPGNNARTRPLGDRQAV